LVRGLDGLFYVPSSLTGKIGVYSLSSTALTKVDEIEIGMPIDNLSVDANGDLFAAAFPDALKMVKEMKNVDGVPVPATVWQIRKGTEEEKSSGTVNYLVWKVLEDRESKVLPSGTTTAVHDAKTGRIFLGGVLSDHITVCEPL
jgi:hypothetical protein